MLVRVFVTFFFSSIIISISMSSDPFVDKLRSVRPELRYIATKLPVLSRRLEEFNEYVAHALDSDDRLETGVDAHALLETMRAHVSHCRRLENTLSDLLSIYKVRRDVT